MPLRGRVRQKDADPTVFNPASRAGVHACESGTLGSFFEEAGLVDNQNALRLSQILLNVSLQFTPNLISTPDCTSEEMLEIGGSLFSQMLCELPAILPVDLGDESPQIGGPLSLHLNAAHQGTKSLRDPIQLPFPRPQIPQRNRP